ncbi:MAG TPA: hypothetical protein VHQ94_00695 [Pyrinomonadaceae bacterium]|jgi:hypothetical protein|nr:hypothetical protein [Pyrinomonadaceae bacterium]
MLSRNVSRQRTVVKSFLWLLCASLMALAAIIPARTESAPTTTRPNLATFKIYCASSLDQPIVYFSNIFDANLKAQTQISTAPLGSAFRNYLVEEYDFKSSSGASCGFFDSLAKAEANKRQLMAQAQQANKRVMEINWNHGPLSETPVGDGASIGIAGPIPTYTFCAMPREATMYYSAVFKTAGGQVNPKWNDAFNEFLYKTYGFHAEVEATCTIMATNREAEAILTARVSGARINSHKVVETGWKFDPTGTYKPAPKPTPKADDDPEPVQRPVAPNPSRQTSDAAMKEVPMAVAHCQKDPSMSAIFICDNFGRAIYNYRMAHINEPAEPLATVEAKLNCVECVDPVRVSQWVEKRAVADKLSNKAINCVTQSVIVNLQTTPQAPRLKEFYDKAVATCGR